MATSNLLANGLSRNSSLSQRVNWSILALLITPYLVGMLWLISSTNFWPTVAPPFAEFVITHRSLVRLASAVVAAASALFFFWPREGGRLAGRWGDYVGLAFTMFFVQYGLRFIELQLSGSVSLAAEFVIHYISDTLIYLCSALNNLLFLAAARILLNKNKKMPKLQASGGDGVFARLIHAIAEFSIAVPIWAWVIASLAPVALLESRLVFLWARFPDAIFSAYCLTWFGYAMAINFNVRRRAVLATLALVVAITYGAGQLVFATHPIIAYTVPPNKSNTFPLPWIRETLGVKVNHMTLSLNTTTGLDYTGQAFLDSTVYALLLPLKFALFLPTFFLYLLFIISANDFRRTLSETISRRKDYLSADGIVRAIGESIGAERVSLFIRIPGVQKSPEVEMERVLPLVWDSECTAVGRRMEDPFPIDDNPMLLQIMKEKGEEIFYPSGRGTGGATDSQTSAVISSPWLVPIKFHGGVIGALQAELSSYRKNLATLQNLRLMAEIVAPSVQDFRSLAAVDQIGFRFTRLQVDHPKDDLERATERMAEVLHDVLAPLATGMVVEIGFELIRHIYPKDDTYQRSLERQGGNYFKDEKPRDGETDAKFNLEEIPVLVRTGERDREGYLQLAVVRLALPAEKDDFSRPTFGANYLHRKAVASLTANAVLDAARDFLGTIIKDLGVEFSKETLSLEEWFQAIGSAAHRAGLLWAVATTGKDEEAGEQEPVQSVSDLGDEEKASLFEQPLTSIVSEHQKLSTRHIIRLNLTRSNHQLWFGVARPSFGPELDFESPWKVFLHELKDVADAALHSLQRRQLSEAQKLVVAQYQGVMTIAVTTGTLMHQLLNMIKDQLSATEVLEEELSDSDFNLNPRASHLLRTMKKSAVRMQELTEAFKSVTKMEERRPCSLRDAAEQAMKLFEVALLQRRIEAEINLSPDIEVDVPFYVAAFALANLIGNARDAIRSNGRIEIEAEDNDNFILCHVTNNGPRIPDQIRDSLFRFGKTSKAGHNGWGLYFVDKALRENGGGIWLAYSDVTATRFTLRFPKQRPV